MGWEALELWGKDAVRIERLAGGVANDVWSVHIHGQLAVGRLGTRSNADLAWEVELLRHLDREGLSVPVPIPADDGRLFADGLMVMTYMHGGPPETEGDWRRVAETLRELHRLTQGWPQRPGWRSSTDLLHAETGTRIDLAAMPPDGVARCRAAWARLIGREASVVHGNPNNPANIRMKATLPPASQGVALHCRMMSPLSGSFSGGIFAALAIHSVADGRWTGAFSCFDSQAV